MGGAWLSLAQRGASAPGVNPALQMRSLALSTVGEFESERTQNLIIFFGVRACENMQKRVSHGESVRVGSSSAVEFCWQLCVATSHTRLLWLVVGLSNWAKRHFFSWFGWNTPHNHSTMEQYQTHILTRIMSMTTSGYVIVSQEAGDTWPMHFSLFVKTKNMANIHFILYGKLNIFIV